MKQKKTVLTEIKITGQDVLHLLWWYEKIQPNDQVIVVIGEGGDKHQYANGDVTLYKIQNDVRKEVCKVSWDGVGDLLKAGLIKITQSNKNN